MKRTLAFLLVGSVLASVPIGLSPRVLAQSPTSTQTVTTPITDSEYRVLSLRLLPDLRRETRF
ncbi:hypothetical protein VB735_25900 [Halotia wernerae UHCC 0503]|nr:hypothetical protein [Halotia wernerae UHCC 0503]